MCFSQLFMPLRIFYMSAEASMSEVMVCVLVTAKLQVTVRLACGICCLLHVRMYFHGHLWKLYTYIANMCRTDWVQQQSMSNAAQCVLVFFKAYSLLMTLVVSVYIDHCLYHRCFYLDSRVQMHTSFYFFFLYGASSFSVRFFLLTLFSSTNMCAWMSRLRACKIIMTFIFFLPIWCMRNYIYIV